MFLPLGVVLAQPGGYVNPAECTPCHARVAATYKLTGMGRSFSRVELTRDSELNRVLSSATGNFHHEPSESNYRMVRHDGKIWQRRWQTGFDGKDENVEELPVDYVMGSGNHALTFLSRTERGTLIELPLGWYQEKAGYWGLNPGYDTAHPPARRPISYECMFCHNAYPQTRSGVDARSSEPSFTGALPEGIDCQRCHGPGAQHIAAAKSGKANAAMLRAAIVNPARLGKDRQMEVCLQCHLETTSTRLPSLVRLFDRAPFSYIAGQPLEKFVLSFDHAPGKGYDDKFEIAGGAYRFRQSACFLKSKGELTCTTCHNPHDVPRGQAAVQHYTAVCRNCHAAAVDKLSAAGTHPAGNDCVSCHMPRRRTEDAVHVVMTDHRIARRPPPGDLLAELPEMHPASSEEYQGEVIPYYPAPFPQTGEMPLYKALAQVLHGSNTAAGVAELNSLLAGMPTARPEFDMALGDALRRGGEPRKAAAAYQQAVKKRPGSAAELRFLGVSLKDAGDLRGSEQALRRATELEPKDPQNWFELGLLASVQNRPAEAVQALRKALELQPDMPDALNSLGVNLLSLNDPVQAEAAFRSALQLEPWSGAVQANLARLLASKGQGPEALFHFAKAARLQPGDVVNLYEYALTLVQLNRFDESQQQAEAAVKADPAMAEAHELLGGLLSRKQEVDAALREYQTAVNLKPEFSRAQLDLGATLAAKGDIPAAVVHLRLAAKGSDARVARVAAQALTRLGVAP